MGKQTIIHKNFNFTWATSSVDEIYKTNIFHNAGVTSTSHSMFYKGQYVNKLPYDTNDEIDEKRASSEYYKLIKRVGEISVLK
jgi:hypothetical protein